MWYMSVNIADNSYVNLREHESSYQAMIRNGDTSNTYDITQRFVKNKETNDFIDNFNNWNWNLNKGLLSDGTYINKSNFFTDSKYVTIDEKRILSVNNIKYFMFKMNCVLERKNKSKINDTYAVKENDESIYNLSWKLDDDGKTIYYYDTSTNTDDNGKISITNSYSSYPLQRIDRLSNYELGSLFLYLNGIKIPDNEIFVYSTKSFTDIFVPLSYIGDLNDDNIEVDVKFNVDIRQAGSEDFYFTTDDFSGKEIVIDLSKAEYLYDRWKSNVVTVDNTVVFLNGKLIKIKEVEKVDERQVKFVFSDFIEGKLELYVLNNIIYRHKYDINKSNLNPNNTKLHFFLDEKQFAQDFVNGPITKNAVSFWYDGIRIDDNLITQTSRYSFEFDINTKNFDESKVDFFVEDINYRIDDKQYIMYGDDYYLLNMLGVSRCVDKMKGGKSYSIFDDDNYQISFKDVLSNGGTSFDVPKAKDYYDNLEKTYKNDKDRCKELIKKNPSLLREMMQQFATPSKRFIVYGNSEDVHISSVKKLESEDALIYYKIYCNHILIDTVNYSAERNGDYDIITINKSVLSSGTNLFEVFQYDLTYYKQAVYRDNIKNMEPVYNPNNGTEIIGYTKIYNISDLSFGEDFLLDDINAVEQIKREWFDKNDDAYYMIYPDSNNSGFRVVKSFQIDKINEKQIKITINLHMTTQTKGYFYLLYKNYNIVNSFVYHNEDGSYMADNDLIFPIYSQYVEYGYRDDGTKYVKEMVDYIPYINNSEPMVTRNGKELIIGEDYLYVTPEKSESVATSYIILKTQTSENDSIVVQFNSAKTNILVLGYNNLNIDNKYGLIYLSELKYPVDPNYMNIFVNGEKVSKYDITILSDKLIRVYNIYRPITSLLITTNLNYKESELKEFIDLYKPTKFELLLEKIFHNCDPSKLLDTSKPNIDYIYTVKPDESGYESNHGFDDYVDDVLKKENPLKGSSGEVIDQADILQVMYINWLNKSGKTRSDNFPNIDINPKVLKYFSVFENTVVGNRLDIFMDSGRTYNGVPDDICGEPIKIDQTGKRILLYPGIDPNIRRKFFFEKIFIPVMKGTDNIQDIETFDNRDPVFEKLKVHGNANILYAEDFPTEPDKNGIMWTGTDKDLLCQKDPTFN